MEKCAVVIVRLASGGVEYQYETTIPKVGDRYGREGESGFVTRVELTGADEATVTVGTAKFELFTKDEGAFVEKPETETKLVEAMKGASVMKIEGKSARGTATSDIYSLDGLSDALDRAAKECSG